MGDTHAPPVAPPQYAPPTGQHPGLNHVNTPMHPSWSPPNVAHQDRPTPNFDTQQPRHEASTAPTGTLEDKMNIMLTQMNEMDKRLNKRMDHMQSRVPPQSYLAAGGHPKRARLSNQWTRPSFSQEDDFMKDMVEELNQTTETLRDASVDDYMTQLAEARVAEKQQKNQARAGYSGIPNNRGPPRGPPAPETHCPDDHESQTLDMWRLEARAICPMDIHVKFVAKNITVPRDERREFSLGKLHNAHGWSAWYFKLQEELFAAGIAKHVEELISRPRSFVRTRNGLAYGTLNYYDIEDHTGKNLK